MSGVVNVFVSSPDTHSERRIDPHITVAQLKGKLELITGIPTSNQAISILASEHDPRLIAELTDDSKMLGYYGLADWQMLKVVLLSVMNSKVEFMICRL
jgi:tubulin-folding cofactor B